ncbi:MAG: methyltransferase domain-containing protein, partial [Planctomycetota bacterium]
MECRVCQSSVNDVVLDLGNQPWCNHFLRADEVGKEPIYPLRLVYCRKCTTAQLDYTVAKETMFADHTYLSGVTRSLDDHFAAVSRDVDHLFFADRVKKSVLDIGSNDGTQLKHYQSLGFDVLGVESSAPTARIANDRGVETLHAFFNSKTASDIGRTFDVINASGVFFHLEELHDVTDAVRLSLNQDGVFVVQFLYMKRILENLAFDQIYHEHLLYYSVRPMRLF